jgi:hypothetical protein
MPLRQSLENVHNDVKNGDLGKARDRLHGLISSFPDNLELRKQLGNIYWQLQLPEMAGRYWYLEEEKDERMIKACQRFEKQFKNDAAFILFAIKFKGQLEPIRDTFAGQTLQGLHQTALEKHAWYKDFRNRGSSKYRQSTYDREKHKTRDAIIKWGFIIILILLVFILCVGVVSVIKWVL